MENIRIEVLKEMRKRELYLKDVIEYVEKNIDDAYNYPCRKFYSLNEWQPDSKYSNQLNQKTVFLTVRMFDLWENALVDILKEKLKKFGVKVDHVHDSIGDLEITYPDGTNEKWEVKSTQSKGDSFTGATHSASKCDNYILISYSMNMNKKLNKDNNKNIINELAVFVWDNMSGDMWKGEPSKNSSWTTLKFSKKVFQSRLEIVVIGKLIPSSKWCKIQKEKLS